MSVRMKLVAVVAVFACAALAAPQVASANKEKTRTVDGTFKLAILESSATVNHFAGRWTGKPFGTSAGLGVAALTNTPTGLITESRSTFYGKKGTVKLKATDAVQFQPDGSISLNGTFKITGGSGRYKGASGSGTFNGALPPGSSLTVGTVVTFDVDGKARY
ncbi:MAG: hypothetical protein ACRDL1_01215 [Solirubrobacterales bacterium]